MKQTPQAIGALQASGLVAYILSITTLINNIASIAPDRELPPALAGSLFLLLFVTSALISGSIALGYPIILFFIKDKKREALESIGWTIAWLVLLGICVALYIALTSF